MIRVVPVDETLWPTLGAQVCDFIEQNLVFGPGDLRGQPVVLDDERRALIFRMYEVYPKDHAKAGRRRFQRCAISLPKGLGKTEFAAFIAACELHPEGPVRCTGWTKNGDPIGGPVIDPYIPFVAYTEEQSDELAYGALRVILEEGPLKDDFDIGLERIIRKKGDGKAVSLSSNPNARDGARTTFMVCDETHRWTLPRLVLAHQTMLGNLPKRKRAQPFMLEITTAPEPGAGSVAEATMEYADAVQRGEIEDSSLFFFHRQAGDEHDLTTKAGATSAVIEASGAAAEWRDIDGIVSLLDDPKYDRLYWERVWCNRLVKSGSQAFNVDVWKKLEKPNYQTKPGALITVGFDGALFHDSTGIVATEVETGYQWVAGAWECPIGFGTAEKPWKVSEQEVDDVMCALFQKFQVWRLYADPPYWQSMVSKWRGQFGEERVIEWWTNRRRQMTVALEGFDTAMKSGSLCHDGSVVAIRHIGNSRKQELQMLDELGQKQWLIRKDRSDSPHKIDVAMASCLSWEARTDAIAAGATAEKQYQMIVMKR